MKRFFLGVILFLFFSAGFAAESVPVKLEHVRLNSRDRASLLRGAQFFASNCMACHTMKYLEHNKLAKEAGITLDKMPLKNKEWFLGVVPPDLTLVVTQHGADWVFTYLHAFYEDTTRPTGSNNLLVKNTSMVNMLAGLQGQQVLTPQGQYALTHPNSKKLPYYTLLRLAKSGSMSPEQFDETMTDLVNFLAYASDPNKAHREHIGIWVLLFLAALFVLAYLLKRSYWKDVE